MAYRHASPQLPLQAYVTRHSDLQALEGGRRVTRSLPRSGWR
ncbi:hypothetical protein ACFODQ_03770 [Comamonas sp. JC664]|jgi:hypothetical protein